VGDGRRTHRPSFAQAQDERSRINLIEADQAVLREPLCPLLAAERAHERRLCMRALRLAALLGDAVIADHGSGEADELLGVARGGERLLVTRHRGGEHGFAEDGTWRTDRTAAKDGSVLENEEPGGHAANTT